MNSNSAWKVFSFILVGTFFIVLSLSMLVPTYPKIVEFFELDAGGMAWASLGFALGATVFQPLFGWLGDGIGRKKILVSGMIFFTIGSLVIALSPNFAVLVLGRFIQGLGAASVLPVGMAYAAQNFPVEDRGKALGMWGMVAALAPVIGPIIGGQLTDRIGWESVFWLSTVLGLVGLFVVTFALPKMDGSGIKKFDFKGVVLLLFMMGGLLNVPSFVNQFGLNSWMPYAWFGLFLIAGFALIKHEQKVSEPIIDVNYAKTRHFWTPTAVVFIEYLSFQGIIMILSFFIINVQEKGSTTVGIVLMPLFLLMSIGSMLSGKLMVKYQPKTMIFVGLLIYLLGASLLIPVKESTSTGYLALSAIIMGLGLGLNLPALINVVVSKAKAERMGSVTSTYNTLRDIATPFGSSVSIVMYSILSKQGTTMSAFTTTATVFVSVVIIGLLILTVMPKTNEAKENTEEVVVKKSS